MREGPSSGVFIFNQLSHCSWHNFGYPSKYAPPYNCTWLIFWRRKGRWPGHHQIDRNQTLQNIDYRVQVHVQITSSVPRPAFSAYRSQACPSLDQPSFSFRIWGNHIPPIENMSLKVASTVNNFGKFRLVFSLCDLRVSVHFCIGDKSALLLLVGASFEERVFTRIFSMERCIVPIFTCPAGSILDYRPLSNLFDSNTDRLKW